MQTQCQVQEAGASPTTHGPCSHDAGGVGPCTQWGVSRAPRAVPRTPGTGKQGLPCRCRSECRLPAEPCEPGAVGGWSRPLLSCSSSRLQGKLGGHGSCSGDHGRPAPLTLLTRPALPALGAGEEGGSPMARLTQAMGTECPCWLSWGGCGQKGSPAWTRRAHRHAAQAPGSHMGHLSSPSRSCLPVYHARF